MQYELHADESEDQRETGRQVDQPVEEPGDEEVQRPQTEQGKGVRYEDDVGLLGHPVDGRGLVEREQEVRAPDGDEDEGQGRQHPPPVDASDEPAAVVLVREGKESPSGGDERVVLDGRILVAVAEQLDRREDQQGPEQQERERERR